MKAKNGASVELAILCFAGCILMTCALGAQVYTVDDASTSLYSSTVYEDDIGIGIRTN
jgi:hypothetical protein